MKVLHVIPSLDPAAGGPPIVAASLAISQADFDCQTQLLSYRLPSAQQRTAAFLETLPGIKAVKLAYLDPPLRSEKILAQNARHWFHEHAEDFDILHLHGVWERLIQIAGNTASKMAKPFVLTPHGMLDPWSLAQKSLKKKLALAMGYRSMLNRAAFLHYLTKVEQDGAQPLNLTAPARVIPNGLFLEDIQRLPPRGEFRAAHPELGAARIVLFLSRLHYKKGLDVLAPAFATISREFPDAHLVVAGPDYGARAPFESQVAALGIAPRVHVIGPIYGSAKLAALRDCDCFCLPSRQEGFSLAIIEAMACEAPVVITPGCQFPDVAASHAGFVAELTPSDIAQAIANVLRDKQTAQSMGQKGRELVLDRFTWPKVAREMVNAYRQTLGISA